jgi:S-adenosylmethionine-diacylglycerol 3-amino-3-carboxypropyl transferase
MSATLLPGGITRFSGTASPAPVPATLEASRPAPVQRITLPDAVTTRLFFSQVREDPALELEAIAPSARDRIVVVGSGGCTALSLLGAGAGEVIAVDLNAAQGHLIELKMAAVATLGADDATAFLGGFPAPPHERLQSYRRLRPLLTATARRYWDGRRGDIYSGVLHVGASERFISLVVRVLRTLVHSDATIRRLLACRTLDEQRDLYRREWNTRRWRALFFVLLNRWMFSRAYDPAFFRYVNNPGFAAHFLALFEHGLTAVPVADNYFLHHMLTGAWPRHGDSARPPYLTSAGAAALAGARDRLTVVDGPVTSLLRTQPSCSVTAFALSNIAEWMTPAQLDAMLSEVFRTAVPGAVLCFRNFVGLTEVPLLWRTRIVEDRPRGAELIRRDRSLVQSRFAVCEIRKGNL